MRKFYLFAKNFNFVSMQLETYISDLLYRYECVTVPEFGAFLTQRVSAKILESNHSFYPPKKELSFNEQIQQNDGLLAHYIADVEKIPYEIAIQKIQKRVAKQGFDWTDIQQVWDKLDEESAEVKEAAEEKDHEHREETPESPRFILDTKKI